MLRIPERKRTLWARKEWKFSFTVTADKMEREKLKEVIVLFTSIPFVVEFDKITH